MLVFNTIPLLVLRDAIHIYITAREQEAGKGSCDPIQSFPCILLLTDNARDQIRHCSGLAHCTGPSPCPRPCHLYFLSPIPRFPFSSLSPSHLFSSSLYIHPFSPTDSPLTSKVVVAFFVHGSIVFVVPTHESTFFFFTQELVFFFFILISFNIISPSVCSFSSWFSKG